MRQLAVVQFLTWLGLFCMYLYFAVAVAHNVFGAQSTTEVAYTEGVIWAGYCSGVYNTVCFLFSPFLPVLARRIGKRYTHSFCLLAGAVGFLSVVLIHNKWLLFLPMVGVASSSCGGLTALSCDADIEGVHADINRSTHDPNERKKDCGLL